jgi:hypothetical protein
MGLGKDRLNDVSAGAGIGAAQLRHVRGWQRPVCDAQMPNRLGVADAGVGVPNGIFRES